MEQIKVSDLATEFQIQYTVVISELKKIGVWVPSADTPVDPDIAVRIRRRLQLMPEVEQETEKAKDKRLQGVKAKKTIKELGKPRKVLPRRKAEEKPADNALAASLKPRRGKGVYRRADEEITAELQPQEPIPAEAELEALPAETVAEVEAPAELGVPEAAENPAGVEAPAQTEGAETKPPAEKETGRARTWHRSSCPRSGGTGPGPGTTSGPGGSRPNMRLPHKRKLRKRRASKNQPSTRTLLLPPRQSLPSLSVRSRSS